MTLTREGIIQTVSVNHGFTRGFEPPDFCQGFYLVVLSADERAALIGLADEPLTSAIRAGTASYFATPDEREAYWQRNPREAP